MFGKAAGIQLVHVPYKGAAPAITDLLGGSLDSVFTSIPSVISHIQSRRIRALAVTSAKRSAALPTVPTIAESGMSGFAVSPWFGLLAPAGTPAEIVGRINDDVGALLATKEVIEAFSGQGAEPFRTTPAEFAAIVRSDIDKWAVVVRESGAKVD
jgi:tripartite-type tricarboxylate transporter receptor subunit TctC